MIDNKLLESFCTTDDTRSKIRKPFNAGEFTYATDGHIGIRVSKRPEYDVNEGYQDIENCVRFRPDAEDSAFVPLSWL